MKGFRFNDIIAPFSLDNGKHKNGIAIFLLENIILLLTMQYLLFKIFISACFSFKCIITFGRNDIIAILLIVIFTMLICVFVSKRYEIHGEPIITGILSWPLVLIKMPKLIKEAEFKRKLKLIKDVIDS